MSNQQEEELKISPEDNNQQQNNNRELDLGKNIYWTDEVKVRIQGEDKYVNEFKIDQSIGRGAFSKVKRVVRNYTENGQQFEEYYAMKMMHKPTLRKERAIRYDQQGQMEMINNLDKVYNEVEVWAKVNNEHFIKIYELIDSDDHDYLYVILELADMGQLAHWDFQKELYARNQDIYDMILNYLKSEGLLRPDQREIEQVAKFIFRQLAQAIYYLHEEMKIIHRDIKLDNILFSSKDFMVKLTDFTVARADIEDETRLFDSEGTPAFTAPECHIVSESGYKPKPTDIWSFGVSLYAYVQQIVPFYASGGELEMQINSRTKDVEIPADFSPVLKDLIIKVLQKDPSKRLTAYEVLQHEFFNT